MKSKRMVVVAGLATLALAACGGDAGSTTELDESPTSIEVDVASGNVTIIGNTSVPGTSVDSEIRQGDPAPSYDLADGVLTITDGCMPDTDCRVDYVVSIAGDADVTVVAASGNVAVSNVAGAITLDAMDGNVTLGSITGDMKVVIGTGSVLGTRLEAEAASFETGSGDVDVTFDLPVTTLVVATSDGDVTVQLPDGPYAFDLSAPDGSVDNRLDDDPAAPNTIALTTDRGSVTVYRR